ncbi:MAG: hypothetical protein KY475_27855 [Planctomycetes bacterium]|nr:hypothetical protein [Planctomycetota bacterium]
MRIGTAFALETEQPQHVAEILPDVLARYGLALRSEEEDSSAPAGIGWSLPETSLAECSLSLS